MYQHQPVYAPIEEKEKNRPVNFSVLTKGAIFSRKLDRIKQLVGYTRKEITRKEKKLQSTRAKRIWIFWFLTLFPVHLVASFPGATTTATSAAASTTTATTSTAS